MWVKVCAVVAMVVSVGALNMAWRGGGRPDARYEVVTNVVHVVQEQKVSDPVVPSNRYVRARLRYGQAGERIWTDVDGARVEEGGPSEWGLVVRVDRRYVLCRDGAVQTWILPIFEDRSAE